MTAKSNSLAGKRKLVAPTGIDTIDSLARLPDAECSIEMYIRAASEYVRRSGDLEAGPKKAGQIRLSNGLGRVLAVALKVKLPQLKNVVIGERKVSGALRTVNADVSEIHPTDGLRMAVELKPVNLAVGRAIWNRFGDIRTFAVNLHLKFPFCIVGGVLVIPTYERSDTREAIEALKDEITESGDEVEKPDEPALSPTAVPHTDPRSNSGRKSTIHLIERAIARLVRAGGRKTEGDAPHLLEGIAVVVYDPDTGMMNREIPASGSGLRWEEFVDSLVAAYRGRFEEL
jgi:hypothetical protein